MDEREAELTSLGLINFMSFNKKSTHKYVSFPRKYSIKANKISRKLRQDS
jgi:hypothetical protein